jgi:D-glycero-beta-D-manno-heptose 1-phosphate adenylyltransferase
VDDLTVYRPRTVDPVMAKAQRILRGAASVEDRFVPDHDELVRLVEWLRQCDCVIAFVTGVWDLFHIGHADYLQAGKDAAAAAYPGRAVVLVVGLDTDALTRDRKGPGRPVVPEGERAKVLAHIRAVDIVTPQYGADQLFRLVPHDVRIISESTQDLPELELIRGQCDHLVVLPPQAETSTTARIRKLALGGTFDALKRFFAKFAPFAALLEEMQHEMEEVRRELDAA